MVIGIDTSRAFISDKTGTENYSYHLVTNILRLPEARSHTFILFTRPNPIVPKEILLYSNVIVKVVHWPYLWTQVGLAWDTWKNPKLDVLWIPAHTLPVLRNPKIKTVVTIHGLEYQWLPEYKNLLQRWYLPLSTFYAAKSADKLIAVSKFTKNELEKVVQNISQKVKVIHEGVDTGRVVPSSATREQPSEYILFVGSVQPRKNLVALVEAFSLFAKQNPDYKLIIAGGIGWMADQVLQAPSRYGVQEKVIFTGRVSDVELRDLYLGATLYAQSSITEGFGLPVLEAMAHGVPVISSDGGALREVVGNAGLVVSLNDDFVKKLAEAIQRVVSDKKLQTRLIAMGHIRVKELSWDRAARATLSELVG